MKPILRPSPISHKTFKNYYHFKLKLSDQNICVGQIPLGDASYPPNEHRTTSDLKTQLIKGK